ncbi:MAG: antitoxin component YwqK of YwqJK toxin-antitoxin module [Planctomycetota bacterium]|jgi:antitoxin component YwqK of YwqJK toxin-antitoxin module
MSSREPTTRLHPDSAPQRERGVSRWWLAIGTTASLLTILRFVPVAGSIDLLWASSTDAAPVASQALSPQHVAVHSTLGAPYAFESLPTATQLAAPRPEQEDRVELDAGTSEDSIPDREVALASEAKLPAVLIDGTESDNEASADEHSIAVALTRFGAGLESFDTVLSEEMLSILDEVLEQERLERERSEKEKERQARSATEHYAGGQLRSSGAFLDDYQVGTWSEWYEDGTPSSVEEYDYDGERHGEQRTWFDDGSPRNQRSYVYGCRHGRWITWHRNGSRKSEVEWRMGVREGYYQEWFSNGEIKEAGYYRDGVREGYWQFYDYLGVVERRTGHYEAGRRVH